MAKICIRCRKEETTNNICWRCREGQYYADLKENLLSGEETETSGEEKVICPWCGEIQNMDDQYRILYEDGDHEGNECQSCGKRFTIITGVSYSYGTEREEDL